MRDDGEMPLRHAVSLVDEAFDQRRPETQQLFAVLDGGEEEVGDDPGVAAQQVEVSERGRRHDPAGLADQATTDHRDAAGCHDALEAFEGDGHATFRDVVEIVDISLRHARRVQRMGLAIDEASVLNHGSNLTSCQLGKQSRYSNRYNR